MVELDCQLIEKLDKPEFKSNVTSLAIKNSIDADNIQKELSKQSYNNHNINIYVTDINKNTKKIDIRDNKSQYLFEDIHIEDLEELVKLDFLKLNN